MISEGTNRASTIRDVAKLAGVSKSLVSLVFRGSDLVSDKSREAVLKAAKELNYRPNTLARQLVSGTSSTLGVVVDDLHNAFYPEVLDGIRSAADNNAFRVIMVSGSRLGEITGAAGTLLEMRVAGLLLLGSELSAEALQSIAQQVPTVVVAGSGERYTKVDTVVNDDFYGAKLAVNHLIGLGHRRIVHIYDDETSAGHLRKAGYEAAMNAAGLHDQVKIFRGGNTEKDGKAGTIIALKECPELTALFVYNDYAAIGAYEIAEARGYSVPADLSICGYDNTSLASLPFISLTTVNQPRHEIGELSVETVIERIKGRTRSCRRVLEPELIIRRSSGPPKAD